LGSLCGNRTLPAPAACSLLARHADWTGRSWAIWCNFRCNHSSTAQIPSLAKSIVCRDMGEDHKIFCPSYPEASPDERQFVAQHGGNCSLQGTMGAAKLRNCRARTSPARGPRLRSRLPEGSFLCSLYSWRRIPGLESHSRGPGKPPSGPAPSPLPCQQSACALRPQIELRGAARTPAGPYCTQTLHPDPIVPRPHRSQTLEA
jgi:hypothetical protein